MDGDGPRAIGANASLRVDGLAGGRHTVTLSGAAANCAIADQGTAEVEVVNGTTVGVSFAIDCGPTTGAIQVTTSTGANADPDGYVLLVDGAESQPIAADASVTLAGLAPGPHSIGLGGLALNCRVEGDNPLAVTVAAGETAAIAIAVACAAAPPETGSLQVTVATTGPEPDPDGYSVSVDGGPAQTLGVSGSLTLDGLAPGAHSVALAGLAANCRVQGENPRAVTIAVALRTSTAFAVTCTPTTGGIAITVSGLPAGTDAAVSVTGPNGYAQAVAGTRTLDALVPGGYTVRAAMVAAGGAEYTASPESRSVTVTAGSVAAVAVSYARAAGPTLNLRIGGVRLLQSIQTENNDVPLVEGRDAFLRVFALANENNTARPGVRVRVFRGGSQVTTLTVSSPGSSTPTGLDEGVLARSWNIRVAGSLIRPGLQLVVEVDPEQRIAESDETDNTFPAAGGRLSLDVEAAAPLALTLVPVRQLANGLEGAVSEGNKDQYTDLARRLHPIRAVDVEVHQAYTTETDAPLDPADANGAWGQVLNEVLALQITEGGQRNYYGVVRVDYGSGIAGLGYVDGPAAMGYDEPSDRSRVLAHELGHNWGRLHSPCGNPGGVDPAFPYPGGAIGSYGFDVAREELKAPTLPDIMGYCANPWISEFTYRAIADFRDGAPAAAAAARVGGEVQRCLLVWGRIVGGRAILEPAFEVMTRPRLPRAPGPYSIQGYSADGATVLDLSFEATRVADGPQGGEHFAFAVPLDEDRAGRLNTLRLTGPGAPAALVGRTQAAGLAGPADSVRASASPRGAAIQWNATSQPMIMVRDPETGHVLSFARRGRGEVSSGKRELDLVISDGVRSRTIRLPVRGR